MELTHKIEAVLLYKNEPVSLKELSKILNASHDDVSAALRELEASYRHRGIVLVSTGEEVSFGTHPDLAKLIEDMQREELSREIGRAGLETLAIVLYKGPVSRREIDYIRGVNSGFILRNLLVRGLVERTEIAGERSYSYKATLELLRHLGVTKKEDLPEFSIAFSALENFSKTSDQAEMEAKKDGE